MIKENCYKIRKLQRILTGDDCIYGLVLDYNIEEDKLIRHTLSVVGIRIVNTRIRVGMRLDYTEGLLALFSSRVAVFKGIGLKGDIRNLYKVLNSVDVLKGRFLLWGIVYDSAFVTIENYFKVHAVGISTLNNKIMLVLMRSAQCILKVVLIIWFYIIYVILKIDKKGGNYKSIN